MYFLQLGKFCLVSGSKTSYLWLFIMHLCVLCDSGLICHLIFIYFWNCFSQLFLLRCSKKLMLNHLFLSWFKVSSDRCKISHLKFRSFSFLPQAFLVEQRVVVLCLNVCWLRNKLIYWTYKPTTGSFAA